MSKPRSGHIGPVGYLWIPYDPEYHQSRLQWAFYPECDSDWWWVRVLGVEFCVERKH